MLLLYQVLCGLLIGVVYVTCGSSDQCLSQPDYQLQGYSYSSAAGRSSKPSALKKLRLQRSHIDVTGMLNRLKKYCYRTRIRSTVRRDDYSSDAYTEPQKGKWVVNSLCDSNPTSTTFKGQWVDGCYLYPEWRNWKCPHVKCNTKLCDGVTAPNKYTWFVCQPDSYYYIDLLVACYKKGKWFLTTKRAWFPRCCGCKKYSWQCV